MLKSTPAPNVLVRSSSISGAVIMYLAWSAGISCLVVDGVWARAVCCAAVVAWGAIVLRSYGGKMEEVGVCGGL